MDLVGRRHYYFIRGRLLGVSCRQTTRYTLPHCNIFIAVPGSVFYATPVGTSRGLLPSQQQFVLNATRNLKEFRVCIKRYLTNQIRSKILMVQPNEWDVATYLPIQQFKKESAKTVWQESVEQIRTI